MHISKCFCINNPSKINRHRINNYLMIFQTSSTETFDRGPLRLCEVLCRRHRFHGRPFGDLSPEPEPCICKIVSANCPAVQSGTALREPRETKSLRPKTWRFLLVGEASTMGRNGYGGSRCPASAHQCFGRRTAFTTPSCPGLLMTLASPISVLITAPLVIMFLLT